MSTKEKLKDRILSVPSDLKYSEMKTFLSLLGFKELNKGSTSGSRVLFIDDYNYKIFFHRPHGGDPLKKITIKQILSELRKNNKIPGI